MANLYVLKIHADGYPAEMDPTTVAPTDTLQLPGTTFNNDVDLGNNSILNVATPVNPDDGVNKAYVDAIASGLDPHESVVVKTDHELGTKAISVGSGGTWGGTLVAGKKFTVQIDGGTATLITLASTPIDRAATITAINTLYGSSIAYAGALGQIDIKSPTWGDDSDVVITLADTEWDDEVGIDDDTQTGVSFIGAGAGATKTYTSPANGVVFNTIDGYLLTSTGQRVLVSMEGGADATVNLNNGVYYVQQLATAGVPLILHRSADADQGIAGELVQGLYVFVSNGTAAQNTGWTMVTTGTIAVDTTPIKFSQFSGAPGLTYDRGLKRSVNSIEVELDQGADAQGPGYTTADRISGLEFDADSAAGQLRVAVQADGGLHRYQTTPFGLGILIDNTDSDNTLGLTSDGIKVLGLPASFTIDDTAVDPLVTADNLTELVDGSSTTLHSHPGAGEAERLEYTFNAGENIALGDPVYFDSAGDVMKCDAGVDAKAFCVGIARLPADHDDPCEVTVDGVAKDVFASTQTIGIRWYVANGGGLTSTVPGSTKHVMQVGFTCAAKDMLIQKQYVGKKV